MTHAIMAPQARHSDHASTASSTNTNDIDRKLKVIIIGAGIAGLSAAVGLRGAGHVVEVFISGPLTDNCTFDMLMVCRIDLRTICFH